VKNGIKLNEYKNNFIKISIKFATGSMANACKIKLATSLKNLFEKNTETIIKIEHAKQKISKALNKNILNRLSTVLCINI
jgi:organic hydroperoxide reductase OsmC/OhrA